MTKGILDLWTAPLKAGTKRRAKKR
jgi:hypothetical protein